MYAGYATTVSNSMFTQNTGRFLEAAGCSRTGPAR